MSAAEQIAQALAERFHADVQLALSCPVESHTWELFYTGPKSLVWACADRVLKVYWSPRDLSAVARSYEMAYRENPDLFPPARAVGTGKILPDGPGLLCIEQARIRARAPSYHFSPDEWDVLLAKWDRLIARHSQPVPPELWALWERLHHNDQTAYEAISRVYFDGLASAQAPFALRLLHERSIVQNVPDLPYPTLSTLSKIVGDISPKHLVLDGPWLAYDLEKYGLGDPAKDLSTLVRFYLYRRDQQNAERVLQYLRDRYDDPHLIYRVYLAALGSGSRLLADPPSKTARERYQLVLDFYPIARRYF